MNAPYKWIKEYCDIDATPLDFSRRMTMSGSKVEGYSCATDKIRNVVAGKILSVEKHPDADKLCICQVDVGKNSVQIVTGATNVAAGDVVPVALDDSELPNGQHIEKGKLRGVESCGMMCSLAELGLTVHDFPECIENGIMQLPRDTVPGSDIAAVLALDDTVIEFEITSNRPDCLCVSGLGREAAVTYGVPFKFTPAAARPTHGDVHKLLKVRIDAPEYCLRYSGAVVSNVKIEPSPLWLRTRLRECGVRPINNIVDITNYIMLEYNQPMHSFDLRNVEDSEIIVRRAHKGEKITTLDEIERELSEDMLVIADSHKPIAVAGVMGGTYSGIYDDTDSVIFESACFEPRNNRATAKALGMRTDASTRYEKGLSPENTMPALCRALELVEQLGAGTVVSGIVDARGNEKKIPKVTFEPQRTNAFLGTDIPEKQMRDILTALEFTFDGDKVVPPYFRGDIECFADVAEEIARIYGYDRIPTTVMFGAAAAEHTAKQRFLALVNEICCGCGLYEINTSSFLNPRAFSLMKIAPDSELRRAVRIMNPIGEETSLLRTTLVASLLDVLARNYKNRVPAVRMFECNTEIIASDDSTKLPLERQKLVIGGYTDVDFYWLKGVVETLAERINLEFSFSALSDNGLLHPGRAASVSCGGETVGFIGELHPEIAKNYGIKTRALVAEIDVEKLFALRSGDRVYRDMPRFPALQRDLALVCDEDTQCADVETVIRNGCGALLESLNVFDVYRGEQLPAGKKSIAFELTLRDAEHTLTDEQADAAVKATLSALAARGVTLRA